MGPFPVLGDMVWVEESHCWLYNALLFCGGGGGRRCSAGWEASGLHAPQKLHVPESKRASKAALVHPMTLVCIPGALSTPRATQHGAADHYEAQQPPLKVRVCETLSCARGSGIVHTSAQPPCCVLRLQCRWQKNWMFAMGGVMVVINIIGSLSKTIAAPPPAAAPGRPARR